jgi:hypothetical protein
MAPLVSLLARAGAAEFETTLWPRELSGACRLPDGRIVLVDDETKSGCFLWDGKPDHPPQRIPLAQPLDDLESAAADSLGRVYLLTSHSLTKKGAAKAERRHLARLLELEPATSLAGGKPRLELAVNLTDTFARALGVEPGAINLEGLAWYPEANQLLFGARSPRTENLAFVVGLGPIEALFPVRPPAGARLGTPTVWRLDLGGRGVRSLDYDPWRRRVWVLAGATDSPADLSTTALYLWDPRDGTITHAAVPGLAELGQVEGVVALGPPQDGDRTPLLIAAEGKDPVFLTTAAAKSH